MVEVSGPQACIDPSRFEEQIKYPCDLIGGPERMRVQVPEAQNDEFPAALTTSARAGISVS